MFISCIWCAASPNISSIRASRVFQGFGMAALQRYLFLLVIISRMTRSFYFYSLFASTIEQLFLYFCRSIRFIFSWWIQLSFSVHERGYRSAIWSFSIMSGVTLSIMSAFVLWILLLTVGITGGLYSTAMWYRIRHGKWGFGLLPYLWGFASSLYYFLFRRCVNQFLSVIWLW